MISNIWKLEWIDKYWSILHKVHGHDKFRTAFSFVKTQSRKKWWIATCRHPLASNARESKTICDQWTLLMRHGKVIKVIKSCNFSSKQCIHVLHRSWWFDPLTQWVTEWFSTHNSIICWNPAMHWETSLGGSYQISGCKKAFILYLFL